MPKSAQPRRRMRKAGEYGGMNFYALCMHMLCVVSRIVSGVLPDRIAPSSVFSRTYSRMYSLTKKRLCGDAFGFYDLYKECRGKHPGGAAAPPALPAPLKQRKSNIINALLYFKYPDKCCYTVLRRGYSPTCVYDPDIKSCFYYLPPFFYTISASHQEIFLYSTA